MLSDYTLEIFLSQHSWKREGKMFHAEDLCWVLPPLTNLALQCNHEIDFQVNNRTMDRDWDGGRHGDYVPFRFQMSHWKRPGADYVPLPA